MLLKCIELLNICKFTLCHHFLCSSSSSYANHAPLGPISHFLYLLLTLISSFPSLPWLSLMCLFEFLFESNTLYPPENMLLIYKVIAILFRFMCSMNSLPICPCLFLTSHLFSFLYPLMLTSIFNSAWKVALHFCLHNKLGEDAFSLCSVLTFMASGDLEWSFKLCVYVQVCCSAWGGQSWTCRQLWEVNLSPPHEQ